MSTSGWRGRERGFPGNRDRRNRPRRLVPLPNRPECSPIDYSRRNVRSSAPYLRLLQLGVSSARSVFAARFIGPRAAQWMVSRTVCFWLITQQVGNGGRYKLRARGVREGRARAREREQWRRRAMPRSRRLCALRKNVNGTFARFGELEYTLTD